MMPDSSTLLDESLSPTATVSTQPLTGVGDLSHLAWSAIIDLALAEDLATGDVTSDATVSSTTNGRGTIIAKAAGIISGLDVAAAVFDRVDATIAFRPSVANGSRVEPDQGIASLQGPARSLLAAERVALNFLQHLSGIATLTGRYVAAVAGTPVRIVDTRKTTPGLRPLEKVAVRHGGGHNHRYNLGDGVLIKDNHLAAVGGPDRVSRAVHLARQRVPHTLRIEVEVTNLEEVRQALAAAADCILLDNMSIDGIKDAVQLVGGRALLEASGNVTLATVRAIAETRVDLISVGALTHSAPALDLSLRFDLDVKDGPV